MRILYLVERFWPLIGGVEVISARALPDLAERGYEIVVVTDRDHEGLAEEEEYAGLTVQRVPLLAPIRERDVAALATTSARMKRIVRDFAPDLVHAPFMGPSVIFARRAVIGDVPVIASFHGVWPEGVSASGALGTLLDDAVWVTACGEAALEELYVHAPEVRGRASAITNGFDPPFEGEPGPPPEGPPVFLCPGRLIERKGFDIAIAAFAKIAERAPGARLLIAGDGPERGALEAQASALGVADRVELKGWVAPDDIHRLVAGAHAVVIPSRAEGLPLTALEAAFGARPIIGTPVGGIPEILLDGETGILCAVDDIGAFAAGMVAIVDQPGKAEAMGRAARERALRDFSARRHVDDWDELYQRIGREPASRAIS